MKYGIKILFIMSMISASSNAMHDVSNQLIKIHVQLKKLTTTLNALPIPAMPVLPKPTPVPTPGKDIKKYRKEIEQEREKFNRMSKKDKGTYFADTKHVQEVLTLLKDYEALLKKDGNLLEFANQQFKERLQKCPQALKEINKYMTEFTTQGKVITWDQVKIDQVKNIIDTYINCGADITDEMQTLYDTLKGLSKKEKEKKEQEEQRKTEIERYRSDIEAEIKQFTQNEEFYFKPQTMQKALDLIDEYQAKRKNWKMGQDASVKDFYSRLQSLKKINEYMIEFNALTTQEKATWAKLNEAKDLVQQYIDKYYKVKSSLTTNIENFNFTLQNLGKVQEQPGLTPEKQKALEAQLEQLDSEIDQDIANFKTKKFSVAEIDRAKKRIADYRKIAEQLGEDPSPGKMRNFLIKLQRGQG